MCVPIFFNPLNTLSLMPWKKKMKIVWKNFQDWVYEFLVAVNQMLFWQLLLLLLSLGIRQTGKTEIYIFKAASLYMCSHWPNSCSIISQTISCRLSALEKINQRVGITEYFCSILEIHDKYLHFKSYMRYCIKEPHLIYENSSFSNLTHHGWNLEVAPIDIP